MDIRLLTSKAKEVCKRTSKKTVAFFKNASIKKRVVISVVSGALLMLMLMSMVLIRTNNVVVYVDGAEVASFSTLKQESSEWLEIAGVEIYDKDSVTVEGEKVYINRAFYVTVAADGVETSFKTLSCSVQDAIAQAGVTYEEADKISHNLTESVKPGDKIVISRMTTDTITKTETLDFETVEKKTDKLYVGEKEVETKGEKGKKEYVYRVEYTDGEETDRKLISETVVKEPVDKVVLVGTKKKPKPVSKPVTTTSNSKTKPSSYKKVYTMKATAYTYGDDGGNVTATGIRPYRGVVAVDPKVIPLGTKLYIESSDGSYVYGEAVAADIGSAIKGNKIDLFLNSESECRKFGRRTVTVYVVD